MTIRPRNENNFRTVLPVHLFQLVTHIIKTSIKPTFCLILN